MGLTEENRKWWILAALTSSISMIFIDQTVLPVAMPTIQIDLNLSKIALQWIINSYLLTITACIIAGGKLADRYGARRTFFMGLILFSFASVLCGLSMNGWWFISARVLQGIGGSLMMPSTVSILWSSFPPHQRGKSIGIYVAIGSVFLASGPFVGGLLTQYLSWRYVFWVNIPVALIGSSLALYSIPVSKQKPAYFDLFGFITFALGISSIVIALMEAQKWGWLSPRIFGFFALGALLIGSLIFFDRKVKEPFVDYSIMRIKLFRIAITGTLVQQFIVMVTVFWAIYYQSNLGYTPAQAGSLSLLSYSPLILSAPIAGRLVDRLGAKLPVIIGFSLVVFSLTWFALFAKTPHLYVLLCALIPFGFGIPLVFTPCFVAALSEVPAERRGTATGFLSMLRQMGSTLGLAVLGTIYYDSGLPLMNSIAAILGLTALVFLSFKLNHKPPSQEIL